MTHLVCKKSENDTTWYQLNSQCLVAAAVVATAAVATAWYFRSNVRSVFFNDNSGTEDKD